MVVLRVRRSAAVATTALLLLVGGTTAAVACVGWPGPWGRPATSPNGRAGYDGISGPCERVQVEFGWSVDADADLTTLPLPPQGTGCPASTTGTPSAVPAAGTPGTPRGESSRSAAAPGKATQSRSPATTRSAAKSSPPATTDPVLWGPYTMTLSNVAPVVDPWQTATLTAPSSRLVAAVTCTSAKKAVVRVSLFDAKVTKLSTAPAVACDGAAHTRTFTVTKGAGYFVSFYADGASVPVTASLVSG